MTNFAELVLEARDHPVPVPDLLRAWRHDAPPEATAVVASVAPETTTAPTDAWRECLRALERDFAPDELGHLTASWLEDRRRPRIQTTVRELRERLRRAAEQGGFEAAV